MQPWLQSTPFAALRHAGAAEPAVAELMLSLPMGQEMRSCGMNFLKETQNASSPNGMWLKPVFWEELLGVCV